MFELINRRFLELTAESEQAAAAYKGWSAYSHKTYAPTLKALEGIPGTNAKRLREAFRKWISGQAINMIVATLHKID